MAWGPGPSEITSISVGGTSTTGNLVEGFSIETAPDSFAAANGINVDRGYVTKTGSFNMLDYSNVTALQTLMTNRSLNTIVATYADADTQTMTSNCVVKVTPIVNQVSDVCTFYALAQAGDYTSLASSFTALGTIVGEPSFTFDFPGEDTDGCGRFYFNNTCRVVAEFELVGIRGATTDIYATAKAFQNVNIDAAFTLSSGNFMVLEDVYAYVYHGNEDASGPRTVRVRVEGVATTWSAILKYTDGAASPLTDAWGTTTNSVDPGDMFAGAFVEFVGTAYSEGTLTTFAVV